MNRLVALFLCVAIASQYGCSKEDDLAFKAYSHSTFGQCRDPEKSVWQNNLDEQNCEDAWKEFSGYWSLNFHPHAS